MVTGEGIKAMVVKNHAPFFMFSRDGYLEPFELAK